MLYRTTPTTSKPTSGETVPFSFPGMSLNQNFNEIPYLSAIKSKFGWLYNFVLSDGSCSDIKWPENEEEPVSETLIQPFDMIRSVEFNFLDVKNGLLL